MPKRGYSINIWGYCLSNQDTSDYPKSTNELRRSRFKKQNKKNNNKIYCLMNDHVICSFFFFSCSSTVKSFWAVTFLKLKFEQNHSLLIHMRALPSLTSLPASPGFPSTVSVAQDFSPAQSHQSLLQWCHRIAQPLPCLYTSISISWQDLKPDLLPCFYLMINGLLTRAVSLLTSSVLSWFMVPFSSQFY